MGKERQRCKEQVPSKGMSFTRYYQCQRYAVMDGYCGQHLPAAVEKRTRKREEKRTANTTRFHVQYVAPDLHNALRLIADGAPDAAKLAQNTLKKAGLWKARDDD